MSQRTTRPRPRPRPRAQSLVLAFQDSERLPERGETVIMAGSFGGVRYAVTVQRIIARERRPDDHTVLLTVKATRRAIAESVNGAQEGGDAA